MTWYVPGAVEAELVDDKFFESGMSTITLKTSLSKVFEVDSVLRIRSLFPRR